MWQGKYLHQEVYSSRYILYTKYLLIRRVQYVDYPGLSRSVRQSEQTARLDKEKHKGNHLCPLIKDQSYNNYCDLFSTFSALDYLALSLHRLKLLHFDTIQN